ncbi:DUF5677 domain-containing protein [Leptospira sp. GIMC2001]|uniref:DUF5677 domain-containing protein n=1 Tax=Leptospira sp. GIMC2001 TaxID=1513297 RepID=UPI002348FF29|nr:DUF5677 domain-containing protein [Leptospira sp. GIMC2001]WCL51048.1 DUF5677 domain-containing protein [Leptospira sp. GIMC2001]
MDFVKSIQQFIAFYPENNPFKVIFGDIDHQIEKDKSTLKKLIQLTFNRRSDFSTVIQSIICISDYENGLSHFPDNNSVPNFRLIIENPESYESQQLHGRIRNHVNSSYMNIQDELGSSWSEYFWRNGISIEKIQIPIDIIDTDPNINHPIIVFANNFRNHTHSIVNDIWTSLPIDTYDSSEYEVVGSLINRQSNIAIKMSKNPDIWDVHIAPILLRSMIDCHITLAWILKSPKLRSKLYISYGLGQLKLQIEHIKNQITDEMDNEEKEAMHDLIENLQNWINSQHYIFLQDVNIGNWSGISTRKMAEEAEILNTYNALYIPFSSATHSMWNHTGRIDSVPYNSPFHKYIRSPIFIKSTFEFDQMYNATKYLSKSLNTVIDHYSLKINIDLPDTWFENNIQILINGLNDNP